MTISEDASTPGAKTGSTSYGTLSLTSAAFTPPSGSLVVVIVSAGHGTGTPAVTVTDSGSHTWTAAVTLNSGNNYAGVFRSYFSTSPGSITVTAANATTQGQGMLLDVRVVDGAASSQTGAGTVSASSTSATSWTGSLTTTASGSWTYLAGAGNALESTVTANSNSFTLNNFQNPAGSTGLSGRQNSSTGNGSPAAVTYGWTVGTATSYTLAGLEILPASNSVAGAAADNASATGKAFGVTGVTIRDYASATGTAAGTPAVTTGSAKGVISGAGAASAPVPPKIVNQWAGRYGQGTTFTTVTSALQSCVVPLTHATSVGGGTGVPTAGNWLFVISSWTQLPSATGGVHVGVGDDVHEWYREFRASFAAGITRTSIAYCPNIGTFGSNIAPGYVYVAPDGEVAAINVLVVEVQGLGPWDTVSTASGLPITNYAAASTSLSLSLSTPPQASFVLAAFGGDNAGAGQNLGNLTTWNLLNVLSQTNGTNHLADNFLTAAAMPATSVAQSITASASTAENLSGCMIAVYTTGISPVLASQNPDWPYVVTEIGFGSGFNTPDSEITWTDVSGRPWNYSETSGIQFQLGALQASDVTIEFDNGDGNLQPGNTASPWYGLMTPGTPVRMRMAFGEIGGNTVNRWYVFQRNLAQWGEEIAGTFRKYCPIQATDTWAALSAVPPTFYRSEVYADSPYAWWPLDDQPGTANVLPVNFLNAAEGNTNTLNAVAPPGGGTVEPYYDTAGVTTIQAKPSGTGTVRSFTGFPPSAAIYQAGTNAGWMFGDPQGSAASIETGTGNPVSATPGSASWQASGQAGNTGSNGWFLSCNDNNFPPLSGGITIEAWFNTGYYAGPNGWSVETSTVTITPITAQPYNQPVTIWEIATSSHPVCILQLSSGEPGSGGALNLITYNGSTATSHSIYTASDLRGNSWHMVTVTLTATTWQVWLDGGVNANVSGTATGMTSAWDWIILNGDLGANGGSSAGTGLVHGANMALSHVAIYPVVLPYYRILDHYWAAVTAFGQLPAPQQVQVSWTPTFVQIETASAQYGPQQNVFTIDGTQGVAFYSTSQAIPAGYNASTGVGMSVVVAAAAPGVTSGPSAWAASATAFSYQDNASLQLGSVWPSIVWTGVAPQFYVYNAASVAGEQQASLVAGDSETFLDGYGGSADGTGVNHVSGGNGSSPPAAASSIGDTVGQRIERLMRYGQTTSTNRCIDPALPLVQAPGQQGGGTQSGAGIQELQQSDNGMLYVDNLNHLTYWQRPHLAGQYGSPVWNLGPSTGKYPYYRDIEWITDPQRVWNTITIEPLSPTGAALPEITPASSGQVLASQKQYGAQPLQVTSWLQSQVLMQEQANWLLANFGTPRRRAQNIRVDSASNPAFWPIVAGANVGDVVTLEDWQIGGGGTVYTMRITEIRRHFQYGSNAAGDSEIVGSVWLTADYEPPSYWPDLNSGGPLPLQITTASLGQATVNTAYSQTLTAGGGTLPYTWAVTSGTLPSWASLNASTGVISGTPLSAGTSSFTIRVTDSGTPPQTAGEPLSITAVASGTLPLLITTTTLGQATDSVTYSQTLVASGGTTPYTWSVLSGSLPSWATLNASTGVISGTPTGTGTASFTVQVKDSGAPAQTTTAPLSITTVAAATTLTVTTTSLAQATDGIAYSQTLTASGGTPAYTWSVTSGSLPGWATLTASTGVISGTPTGTGTASFTVKVTDSVSSTATQALSITTVAAGTITPPDGPSGTWSLAWNDEFNDATGMSGPTNGLARTKWNLGWYSGPSTPGGPGYTGLSFTDSSGGGAIEFYGPAAISWPSGGGIAFSCFAQGQGPDGSFHGSTAESGGINTAGIMNITPNTGYSVPAGIASTVIQAAAIVVEVSAKFAGPNSVASEYWQFIGYYNCGNCTTPGYPDSGYHEEIDVWEERAIGTTTNSNGSAYHFHLEAASAYSGGDTIPSALANTDMSLAFHKYTFEVTYSTMTCYVDGLLCNSVTPTVAECEAQWSTPQYLNLLFQILSGYVPTGTSGATPWVIQYVRVFT